MGMKFWCEFNRHNIYTGINPDCAIEQVGGFMYSRGVVARRLYGGKEFLYVYEKETSIV
jgi:hypothetical protein